MRLLFFWRDRLSNLIKWNYMKTFIHKVYQQSSPESHGILRIARLTSFSCGLAGRLAWVCTFSQWVEHNNTNQSSRVWIFKVCQGFFTKRILNMKDVLLPFWLLISSSKPYSVDLEALRALIIFHPATQEENWNDPEWRFELRCYLLRKRVGQVFWLIYFMLLSLW